MTTLILSSVGKIAGNTLGGPLGGAIGGYLGASIGSYFDRKLFNLNKTQKISGYRLDDLAVQTSTYGKTIPIVYGKMRISGNIIWSTAIKEVLSSEMISQQYGKGFSRPSATIDKTNYNYYVTMAIAICEGEIDGIERIWADNKLLDQSKLKFRLYKGTETQNPDSFMQSIDGIDKTPAYRGLAYIFIEEFQINEYGSHIPNFTFEVKRNLLNESSIENQIQGVNIIPASGEFVYDTEIQFKSDIVNFNQANIIDKKRKRINNNTDSSNLSDAVVSLNQMHDSLPNIQYISVVVAWFADDLNIGKCKIYPAIENRNISTFPDEWSVFGLKRKDARIITKDKDGNPIYGGTISDKALINYLKELKKRNYKVMLYPMLFLDLPDKPWRGRMTGDSNDVNKFFDISSGAGYGSYSEFILHYANLTKDLIEGIVIGSEMKGITSINEKQNNQNIYPAVKKFIELANKVRNIIEPSVAPQNFKKIITYASDWSEYHSYNGEYNLDELWASDNINVIGIDAYFPLTDIKSYSYQPNLDEIEKGWTSGEGYDYYYKDGNRDNPIPYTDPSFAWKNIEYWWSNEHTNYPSGIKSPWKPKMKKIWFTEYGFPSIHGSTNMPNIFYNPESSEGGLPVFSNGGINFDIQRVGIEATISKWKNSLMVERMFLWCYDARPYPYFPLSKNLWSDGDLWTYGHWINGKLGRCLLARIIEDLMERLDLNLSIQINTRQLSASLDGFIINNNITIIDALKILQQCYFFDILENREEIKFLSRGYGDAINIDENDIILNKTEKQIIIKRNDEFDIARNINFSFISSINDYDVRTANVSSNDIQNENIPKYVPENRDVLNIDVPIAMNISYAESLANIILYSGIYQREQYEINLPISYSHLEPGDLIKINGETLKIISINHSASLKIQAIIDDYTLYFFRQNGSLLSYSGSVASNDRISKTSFLYGVIPAIDNNGKNQPSILFAGCGEEGSWRGAIGLIEKNPAKYEYGFSFNGASNFGETINKFTRDETILYVQMNSGELVSITDEDFNDLNNDDNLAFISGGMVNVYGEVIKYKKAELIDKNIYKLTEFKRGLFSTDIFIDKHESDDKFIAIDEKTARFYLNNSDSGKTKKFKIITLGDDFANGEDIVINQIMEDVEYYTGVRNPEISRFFGKDDDRKLLIKWDFERNNFSFKVNIIELFGSQILLNKSFETNEKQLLYEFMNSSIIAIIYLYKNGEKRGYGLYLWIDGEKGEVLKSEYIE